ncbi:MAG: hypothetical protein Q8Q12_14335 [bacterium]|nr:hypothetical protein [bacterium]
MWLRFSGTWGVVTGHLVWARARGDSAPAGANENKPTLCPVERDGIGCTSAHYPLAYGYKYDEWSGAFGEVWFGLKSNFWWDEARHPARRRGLTLSKKTRPAT